MKTIRYVNLDWLILAERDDPSRAGSKTLLITHDIIEKHAFHDTRFYAAWEESALKAHLGDERFLLDIDEATRYFPDNAARISHWNGEPRAWWLRTMGIKNHAAYVGKDGGINAHGYRVDCPWCGIRPAMWVDLEELA